VRLGLPMEELVSLDEAAGRWVQQGSRSELDVVEAGRHRLRVHVHGAHGVSLAARRVWLPDTTAATTWEGALADQERALQAADVNLLPGAVQAIAPPHGGRVLWIVRVRVPDGTSLEQTLRRASPQTARSVGQALVQTAASIAATRGAAAPADPQAWAWLDGQLVLTHADVPHTLSAITQLGPWRWYAPLLRGAWLHAHSPLEREPTRLLAGILGPLAELPALEGLLPVVGPHLGTDAPAREHLLRAHLARSRWSRRVQALRRPR